MRIRNPIVVLSTLFLAGCVIAAPRTSVTVGYYNLKGTSFEQLDRQIALHGPTVEGVGRAVAATRISMLPDVRFGEESGECRVTSANIRVKADVTLPRLSDRRKASKELRPAFSSIERYAKQHEAVHVAIADNHAEMAERAILKLPAAENCDVLKAKAVAIFEEIMAKHRAAQLKFDADEKVRLGTTS